MYQCEDAPPGYTFSILKVTLPSLMMPGISEKARSALWNRLTSFSLQYILISSSLPH